MSSMSSQDVSVPLSSRQIAGHPHSEELAAARELAGSRIDVGVDTAPSLVLASGRIDMRRSLGPGDKFSRGALSWWRKSGSAASSSRGYLSPGPGAQGVLARILRAILHVSWGPRRGCCLRGISQGLGAPCTRGNHPCCSTARLSPALDLLAAHPLDPRPLAPLSRHRAPWILNIPHPLFSASPVER